MRILNRIISIGLCCLLNSLLAGAQTASHSIQALSGPAGNYLYLNLPGKDGPPDTAKLAATDYYQIERSLADSTGASSGRYEKVGKARPVQSARELRKYYSEKEIAELQEALSLTSEDALVDFFRTHRNPDDYFLYYLLLQTKLATGDVFLDESARKGVRYTYRATRVGRNADTEPWGAATVLTGAPNEALRALLPSLRQQISGDSSLLVSWSIPADSLMNAPSAVISKAALQTTAGGLKAHVWVQDGDSPYYEAARLLPNSDDSSGIFGFLYTLQQAQPEHEYHIFLRTEDEVGNTGVTTDTATLFTVGPASAPFVSALKAAAVQDGVRLSWPPVPQKPFIAGIRISRYDENGHLDSLAVLPFSDTSFTDYKAAPGISYSYHAALLYLPGTGLRQTVPAQAIGTAIIFSKPAPPYNLKASLADSNIRIEWESNKAAGLYDYYIYRGTSAKNLDRIAGPVKSLFFIDTTHALSGRSQYFYAVQAENLSQDQSGLSDVVSIQPKRRIATVMPRSIQFYFANGTLHLSWPDIRENDNAITGFVVRGREQGQNAFRYHSGYVPAALTTDSIGYAKGRTYQYQVAAVSMRGDTSAYSEFYDFSMEKDRVGVVNMFYVRNIAEGVQVSWPTVVYENRKAYNIYRRGAAEEAYTKVASVPADQFAYTDAGTRPNEVYVYAMSITESDDREGTRGQAQSIRRAAAPVKATTISE